LLRSRERFVVEARRGDYETRDGSMTKFVNPPSRLSMVASASFTCDSG
jgi:hypothetical protein